MLSNFFYTQQKLLLPHLGLITACTMITACSMILGCTSSEVGQDQNPVAPMEDDGSSAKMLSSKLNDYFDKNRNRQSDTSLFGPDGESDVDSVATQVSPAETANPVDSSVDTTRGENNNPSEKNQNVVSQGEIIEGKSDVDVNRLFAKIGELTEIQRTAETTDVMRDTLIEQADLANQIYNSATSFQFKINAVKTRIHALTILDKLNQPNAAQELEDFCKSLLERSESELKKMGLIGMVSSQLRSYLKDSSSQDFEEIVKTVDEFTKSNFDDLEMGRELAMAASQLFTNRKRDQAVQLMSVLSENFRNSSEPQMIGLADTLNAQMAMATANFDKAVAKQIADEQGNMPHLNETMDQIMESGVTLALYNELISWMQLFEREARYDSIDLIASKLQKEFRIQSETEPDKFIQVLDTLDLVRTRMALVGKPFSFEGIELADGKPFDPTSIEGKIVLISFWSGNALPEERLQLQFETKSYEDWSPMGLEMVGFNMDNDPESAKSFFGTNPPRWINTKSSDAAELGYESDFAKRAVADRTPYRILLDQDGKVVYVAVPVQALATRVSSLLKQLPPETKNVQDKEQAN